MDENLCSNLITWLKIFPGHDDLTVSKLSDGVALGTILHTIAPEYFDAQWISKIKADVGDNWRLKVSNLRKIHQGVVDYLYLTELAGQSTPQITSPDLNKIVEHEDKIELGRLLQLVLFCAINCERKEKHIEAIMRMEEGIQASLMNAIRDLMINPEPSSPQGIPDFPPQINSLQEQLEVMSLAKEELERRCNELDLQISVLNEDKKSLREENEKLVERIEILESGGEIGAQGFRVKDLRKQVDKLQDELFKVESSRDEYRSRVESLEKENTQVISKNEELQKLADEARSLKDEVDALRDMSDKVVLLEGSVETYKKRLEELSNLRKQVKILEEKNTEYMHQIMELEEEVKKSGTWRPQLDLYKKQVSDLHQKLSDEAKKTDRQIFENKKLMENLEAVTQEKKRVLHERDVLKETIEDLKLTSQSINSTSSGSKLLSDSDLDVYGIPPEIREELRRLQHENSLLKKKASDTASKSGPILQSLLNDLEERHDKLLQENRELNQKIMVLEDAKIEEERKATQKAQSESISVVPKSHVDSRKVAELERKLSEKGEKISSLEETISKRESEMAAMEERYKKYLNKAKSVIKQLDPKHNPALVPDVSVLRSQLTEKDKIIENMEKETEKSKMIREMEEKLISTAFYNYGMQMHRQMINQRLSALDNGQSFLSRQRQASSQRTMRSNVGNSNYYDY